MFEPRLLTEEEAQWRASCGWHVDRSAVSAGPSHEKADQRRSLCAEFLIEPYRQGVNPDKHW